MKYGLSLFGCLLLLLLMAFAPPQRKHKRKPSNQQESRLYKESGSELPPFRVRTTAGSIYTNDSIPDESQLLLVLFNPTCDHCGMVTDTLLRYYDETQKIRLLFVAGDNMMPYLPEFVSAHHLEQYPSVRIGIDSSGLLQKTFLYEPLPQVNVYDRTRRLIRIFTGLQPGSSFLPYLKNER